MLKGVRITSLRMMRLLRTRTTMVMTGRGDNFRRLMRYDAIWCCRTTLVVWFCLPWRASRLTASSARILLLLEFRKLLLLGALHGRVLLLQLKNLLRSIIAGDLSLVSFPAHFGYPCAVILCFGIDGCPVLGNDSCQFLERDLAMSLSVLALLLQVWLVPHRQHNDTIVSLRKWYVILFPLTHGGRSLLLHDGFLLGLFR